jgi:hypothetical protein
MANFNQLSKADQKGFLQINSTSEKCLAHLMSKGKTKTQAEDMILEILKECQDSIKTKQFGMVCELLEMTFMDKPLKDININKVLGI